MQTEWPTPATPGEFAAEVARTVASFRDGHPEIVYEGMG